MANRRYKGKGMAITAIVAGAVTLAIGLLVGNQILDSVADQMNSTEGAFATAASFLGVPATTGAVWSTTSILGVLGLAAVAGFVLFFVKRVMK